LSLPVKLKICGITSIEDARAAVDCGAAYLGFNFYRPSPRYLSPAAARAIIRELPDGVRAVGVFVNEARPGDVAEIMAESGVGLAQLHGDEDPAYCEALGAERVIKALRIGDDFDPRRVLDYPAMALLLDTYDPRLYGGTGRTANWGVAHRAARLARVFLAGGLAPENLRAAISAVEPFAVDLNSGVESAPGRKDRDRLRLLKKELEACL
jgi:phosphoribosylanthranilate isomerase